MDLAGYGLLLFRVAGGSADPREAHQHQHAWCIRNRLSSIRYSASGNHGFRTKSWISFHRKDDAPPYPTVSTGLSTLSISYARGRCGHALPDGSSRWISCEDNI